jgi:glycosyltransferase involved in cell wall biosynthesis
LAARPEYETTRLRLGCSGPAGHLWEQQILSRHLPAGALLWSPGGAGPMAVANQILTIHDIAHLEHPEWYSLSFSGLYRFLLPRLASRVQHILTISEYSRQRITQTLGVPADRITVVHPGISGRFGATDPVAQEEVRARHSLHDPYILAVGAISARKNIARLFDAWRIIANRVAPVRLAIVGEAGMGFSTMSSAGALPPRTLCLGRVGDDDLVALYGGALAFVYPSLYEGFGLPPLEAMAGGCPVVCSNATSLPEAVGDAALPVDPMSVDSIASGLVRIIEDDALRDSLRTRGPRQAARFTWDHAASRIDDLLHRAAAN